MKAREGGRGFACEFERKCSNMVMCGRDGTGGVGAGGDWFCEGIIEVSFGYRCGIIEVSFEVAHADWAREGKIVGA